MTAEVVGSEPAPGALEQHPADEVALHLHGVQHAIDVGQQFVRWHQRRVDTRLDAVRRRRGRSRAA